MREGLYVTGISAEALQNLCDDFLACGMYYYRLNLFSDPPLLDSFYKSGLTYHAFLGAIRNYLQYYRAAVLSIPSTKTLIQLKVLCHKLIKQLRLVSCFLKNKSVIQSYHFPSATNNSITFKRCTTILNCTGLIFCTLSGGMSTCIKFAIKNARKLLECLESALITIF